MSDILETPPCVVPGERIVIQLRGASYLDLRTNEWVFSHELNNSHVKTVRASDDCAHSISVCPACVGTWHLDYLIEFESDLSRPVVGDE